MTQEDYDIVMAALDKLKAEVTASPEAAEKFLIESGLGDILDNAAFIEEYFMAPKASPS